VSGQGAPIAVIPLAKKFKRFLQLFVDGAALLRSKSNNSGRVRMRRMRCPCCGKYAWVVVGPLRRPQTVPMTPTVGSARGNHHWPCDIYNAVTLAMAIRA
jgi:hypothetical protein